MAAMGPVEVVCPACGTPIRLPARLVMDPVKPVAQILLDLDPVRDHAREHQAVLPAALERFGLPW
jgi:hypothetical protein